MYVLTLTLALFTIVSRVYDMIAEYAYRQVALRVRRTLQAGDSSPAYSLLITREILGKSLYQHFYGC